MGALFCIFFFNIFDYTAEIGEEADLILFCLVLFCMSTLVWITLTLIEIGDTLRYCCFLITIFFYLYLCQVQFEVTIAENVEAIVCCEAKISGKYNII